MGQKPSCHFYCNFPGASIVAFTACLRERKERETGRKEEGKGPAVSDTISRVDKRNRDRKNGRLLSKTRNLDNCNSKCQKC